jgi:PilZ domain
VNNVISMDKRPPRPQPEKPAVRDRRYAIRYPFAVDAQLIELDSGNRTEGVTSDVSLGGCFICTSKPLVLSRRVRVILSRKGLTVEGLAVVRVVKPRIGMGIEFLDLEPQFAENLCRWIEQGRQRR